MKCYIGICLFLALFKFPSTLSSFARSLFLTRVILIQSAMHGLFRKKVDFGILPGGMEEVAMYTKGRERVYLKHRAGFIKYALQHGCE